MKVAKESGILRYFTEYGDTYGKDTKLARTTIYAKYHRFISANTPSSSKTDIDRIFHKVFNLFAYHEMIPGSNGKLLSFNDLMYNKVNSVIRRKSRNARLVHKARK